MPLFDFKCLDCGQVFEGLVLRQLDPPSCPGCTGKNLEQLISTFSVDSDGTRENHLTGQRRKHAKARRDYEMAQREHEQHHHH
jgi:putative FmdB family regulatory protein